MTSKDIYHKLLSSKVDDMTDIELHNFMDHLRYLDHMKKYDKLAYTNWGFYSKQRDIREEFFEFFDTGQGPRVVAIIGANRSGKSATGASIVAELFSNPRYSNKKIWCATESDMSIKVQQQKLYEWIPRKAISCHDTYNFNKTRGWKNRIIVSTKGNCIWFKSYQQERESFQGEDLDLIALDEEPPYGVFQECLARLVDRNGMILFTFTSLKGYTRLINWLYKQKDNVKIHVLTLFDNPYLSKKAKDNFILNLDPDDVEARVYGKIKLTQGLVYKEFSRSKHVIAPFDYIKAYKQDPDRYMILECIDPHARTPHRWVRILYDKKQDIMYVVDELIAPVESMIIIEFSKIIKAKRGGVLPRWTEIDTSSQQPMPMKSLGDDPDPEDHFTVRTEFSKAGITTILCLKDNDVGIRLVKERLHTFKTEDREQKPTLFVFSSCEDVIKEFELYQWDTHVSDKVAERKGQVNRVLKKNDHFMDSIKYLCLRLNSSKGKDIKVTTPKFYK